MRRETVRGQSNHDRFREGHSPNIRVAVVDWRTDELDFAGFRVVHFLNQVTVLDLWVL
jgi:hypothetical protein